MTTPAEHLYTAAYMKAVDASKLLWCEDDVAAKELRVIVPGV
jgi:hypothetical protein